MRRIVLALVMGILLILATACSKGGGLDNPFNPEPTPPPAAPVAPAPTPVPPYLAPTPGPAQPAPTSAPAKPPAQPTTGVPPTQPSPAPSTGGQMADCPSPEVASKILAIDGKGPAWRSIGNATWLGGNRESDDVCAVEFDQNNLDGKTYRKYHVPAGAIATSNETDNKVRVWKGPIDVTSSAATVRFLDEPKTGQPIYSPTHRFRNPCIYLANEIGFTQIEAQQGGFVSEFSLGNLKCDSINLQATGSAQPASGSSNSQDVIDLLVRDANEAKRVSCDGPKDGKNWICSSVGNITWTHPGDGADLDYWSGFPAPKGASGCQVVKSGPTQSVVCSQSGATFTADRVTYRPK